MSGGSGSQTAKGRVRDEKVKPTVCTQVVTSSRILAPGGDMFASGHLNVKRKKDAIVGF